MDPQPPKPSNTADHAAGKSNEAKPTAVSAAAAGGASKRTIELPVEEHRRLEEQAKQAEQQRDQYLRSIAEFENTKKRLQREKEEFARYAAEGVIRELLPILDGLNQALVAVDKQSDAQAVVTGVRLIHRQLLGLLQKEGVERIPTAGERFDPHKHEAVGQVDTDGQTAEGTIVEEIQAGYTMHGKIIRSALVKVAKQKTSDTNQQSATNNQPSSNES